MSQVISQVTVKYRGSSERLANLPNAMCLRARVNPPHGPPEICKLALCQCKVVGLEALPDELARVPQFRIVEASR